MSAKRKAAESLASAPKKAQSIGAFFKSDPTSSPKAEPVISFDKNKWLASLDDRQKQLLALEIATMHDSWLSVLKDEITQSYFLELKEFLAKEKSAGKTVYPPDADLYSWSRYTPLNTVKVVILGQDPYHGPNQAHGLCFSVKPPTVAPRSLVNIYKCLKIDYPSFTPPSKKLGYLEPWARQGVLMLNAALTVRKAEARSHHGKGWEKFTSKVIQIVSERRKRGVVFLAWGRDAQEKVGKVDKNKHNVLKSVHPSPLSASGGFFECAHFKKTNDWLELKYGVDGTIDWNLGDKEKKPAAPLKSSPPPLSPSAAAAALAVAKAKSAATEEKANKIVSNLTDAEKEALLSDDLDEDF